MRARRRLPADPRLVLYTASLLATSPLHLVRKSRKLRRHGHEHEGDPHRWTCRVYTGRAGPNGPPPRGAAGDAPGTRGPRVAFVGAGFGEMRLIERLDDRLRAARPDVATTWCFKTREPAETAARARPDQPLVSLPFDFAVPVHNWLRNVDPDVVVFVEQMNHPTLARGAAASGAAVCLVNGLGWAKSARAPHRRLSQRVFRRWVSGAFSFLGFQSAEQFEKARPFLAPDARATVVGNMKFDVHAPAADGEVGAWLASRGSAALLAAGSTRLGDEEFLLDAFARVRAKVPACALLLAPRQIDRADELDELATGRGLRVSRRSRAVPLPRSHPADVYVLDTMGELVAAYEAASAAFVGGTLRHHGHNVLEPLVFGLPVSYGPLRGHWAAEQRALEEAGIGVRVSTPQELATHWVAALSDPSMRVDVARKAAALFERQRGATARSVEAIVALLDGLPQD